MSESKQAKFKTALDFHTWQQYNGCNAHLNYRQSICLSLCVCLSITLYGCIKTVQKSQNLHYRLPQIRF